MLYAKPMCSCNLVSFYVMLVGGQQLIQVHSCVGVVTRNATQKTLISRSKLFGASAPSTVLLDEGFNNDIPKISAEENEILTANFTEKEVFEAISQIETNKAPGPDGFPAEFYKTFWNVIKNDLMAMFVQFQEGNLPLYKLNFGVITLLPKKENAVQIQQYRPICLLNVSFKIFTKVGTNRITGIAHKVIRPTQSAFMPG